MRLLLYLRVYLVRVGASLNSLIDRYKFAPRPPQHALTLRMPTQRAPEKGSLTLYVYTPAGYRAGGPHPLVVNFHGGGFTIGHATDDARLAAAILSATDAVFVSVGYRKGPRHAAPVAALDAADAIEWLWAHATSLYVDPHRTVTTGSSAGGNLCLAAPLLVHEAAGGRWGAAGSLAGVAAIYPSVDQTIPREQKAASNPISRTHGSISPALYKMFDDSYYTPAMPPAARRGTATSPGLASDDAIRQGLPDRLAVYTCEWDQLLPEGEEFRKRLKRLGKDVQGYLVEKAPHGFDKDTRLRAKYQGEVDRLYGDVAEQIKRMVAS